MDCPTCGEEMLEEPWWDDAPENGGACIGSIYSCGACDQVEWV